ncbi:CopG family transcriptional regulator [Thiothrix winogradskyi]|uniref:CopG family transcriptional regulator n=1 Tax=Thiothrix winogradskyi TaxID=96472 RepID=A0ABY3SX14_9GAMM|nr:CopG family transcriptional regulator [Thiothrix winogradskyi]UJS23920.1 CopG family transcriptional regulator [Thiothrix winogradskyi]
MQANNILPTSPKLKTLLERLRTVEKINASPDLSENHSAYLESHSEELAKKLIREDVQWGLHGKH